MHIKNQNTSVENSDNCGVVMLINNQLGYGKNCSMTPRSLWDLHIDQVNNDAKVNSVVSDYKINNNKITRNTSFLREIKIILN